jgi:transcriptional regulator with XRE-family HTH domain
MTKVFGERLKQIRVEKGFTQDEVAKHLGLARPTITQYEKGLYDPSIDTINKLADLFKINVSELLESSYKPVKKIPIVGSVSCGKAVTDNYQGNNEFAYYNGEYWTPNLYCVIACGDSMSPFIDDGDEVICDPERKPQHGDIVEYKIHNEKAIKIFTEDKNANIIQLVPYNQNNENFQTRTIRLDDDEANELEMSVVVAVNKLAFKNRKAILKAIGRG